MWLWCANSFAPTLFAILATRINPTFLIGMVASLRVGKLISEGFNKRCETLMDKFEKDRDSSKRENEVKEKENSTRTLENMICYIYNVKEKGSEIV